MRHGSLALVIGLLLAAFIVDGGVAQAPKPNLDWPDLGLWVVKVEDGEKHQLLRRGTLDGPGIAVSPDLKLVAIYGQSQAEREALAKGTGKDPIMFSSITPKVSLMEPEKKPKVIWESMGKGGLGPNFPLTTRVQWSANGKRLLVNGGWEVMALDTKGNSQLLPRDPSLDTSNVRWAGKSDAEIVVGAHSEKVLKVVTLATKAQRVLCLYPPDFVLLHGQVEVSSDLGAVAFFAWGPGEKGAKGVWVWRRGLKAPTLIHQGEIFGGQLSPDGNVVVAALRPKDLNDEVDHTLWNTTTGKVVWIGKTPKKSLPQSREIHAFDSTGKRLAIGMGTAVVWTPTDKYDPRELVKLEQVSYVIGAPKWSADGKSVFFGQDMIRSNSGLILVPR